MAGNINIPNVTDNAKSKRVHIVNKCLKHNFDKPKFVETFSRKLSIMKPFCKIRKVPKYLQINIKLHINKILINTRADI